MTTTLARRIRRIGILPTTYKEVMETVLRKNDAGEEITVTNTKKVPIKHYSRVAADTRASEVNELRTAAKAKRVASRKK